MSIINKAIRYVLDSDFRFIVDSAHGKYDNMPDREYIERLYRVRMGKHLNLDDPQTFIEKIQWLKLYDHKPQYTDMVDKCEAKKIAAALIGDSHIIPTIGVWDSFDDIPFDSLPDQFVIKCTHDSGGLVICRDKKKFDKKSAREKINRTLKQNFFLHSREWPYKNVKPRIIAEKYMENTGDTSLTDYKFFCFNGNPEFIYVSNGLENHATAHMSFVSLDWKRLEYQRSDYLPFDELPEKPKCLAEMIEMCKIVSKNIPFLRVDLYEINGIVYFSEFTFSTCSGMIPFTNIQHDIEIGKKLVLPEGKIV